MKLTKLKIHKYRSVAPGSELVFSPTFNLVLGENGTGRTTLLDLVSLVLASDFSGLGHEEFSLEYGVAFSDLQLRVAVRNEERSATPEPLGAERKGAALLPPRAPERIPDFEPFIEVELRLAAPESRLVMRADAAGIEWEVDGKPGYSQSMRWSLLDRSVWVLLFMTAQYLAPEVKDRLKGLLRRIFLLAPARFDEGLGTFEQIGRIQYVMEIRKGEVFPLGLMALPTWLPGKLRERVEREPSAASFEIPHAEVKGGFLATFVELAGFTAGTFRGELLEKRAYDEGGRLEFGRFGFSFTRRDGSVLAEAHLGHAQKRMLSFLYYLDVNEDFVIADELANGLHPRWIEACLRGLGDRQAFLTSQNPLVFEHVPLASAEELRAALVLCGFGVHDGRERLVWSNPTVAAAEKLFEEYRRGGAPLGDLLRAHGLW